MIINGETLTLTVYPDRTTYQSCTIRCQANAGHSAVLAQNTVRKIRWSYYPSGRPSDKTVHSEDLLVFGSQPGEKVIDGLTPGWTYVIEAQLLHDNVEGDLKAVTVKTIDAQGVFEIKEKSSSVITATVSGLPVFDYDVKVKFSIALNKVQSYFKEQSVYTIPKGSQETAKGVYSGLRNGTKYNIKAQVYKVINGTEELMQVFDKVVTTEDYGAKTKTTPFFVSHLAVTGAGVACLRFGVDGEDDECTIHLYSCVRRGGDYSDMGEVTGSRIKLKDIVGVTRWYKLAAVDEDGKVYNQTEPYPVSYHPLDTQLASRGAKVNIEARYMLKLAKALYEAYDYLKETETVTANMTRRYTALKSVESEIRKGNVIEGGDDSPTMRIVNLAYAISGSYEGADLPFKNKPLTAVSYNSIVTAVKTALGSIGDET